MPFLSLLRSKASPVPPTSDDPECGDMQIYITGDVQTVMLSPPGHLV